MPRALKSDKFFHYAPKKRGPLKGQMVLGINHTYAGEINLQDLIEFLKEIGIEPSKVPLYSLAVRTKS